MSRIEVEGIFEVGEIDGGFLPSSFVVYQDTDKAVSMDRMVAMLYGLDIGSRGHLTWGREESAQLGRVRITIERLEKEDE